MAAPAAPASPGQPSADPQARLGSPASDAPGEQGGAAPAPAGDAPGAESSLRVAPPGAGAGAGPGRARLLPLFSAEGQGSVRRLEPREPAAPERAE